jgi:hypothetical protein
MLGETNGGSGQIEALGGDAIDELLGRIKGNGGGSEGGGGGGGGGDDDGHDGGPIRRVILDGLRRLSEMHADLTFRATEATTAAMVETAQRIAAQATRDDEIVAKELAGMISQALSANTRLAEATADALAAMDKRLARLEAEVAALKTSSSQEQSR